MRKKSVPTFIGLFVLIFGLAAALVLIRGKQIFKLGATSDFAPQDVRVTNLSDNTFTVSWTTGKEALSFIRWGATAANLDKKVDGASKNPAFIHSVSVSGVKPTTTYFFKINSGGTEFANGKNPWQVITGRALPPPEKTNNASGSVLTATGAPAGGALVYLTVGGSSLLSTVASQNGNWIIPISSARTEDLSSYVSINESSTVLEITVNAGPEGVAAAQVFPQSAKPAPPIILGEVNDFKNAPANKLSGLPEASIKVPEETTSQESGFDVEGETAGTPPETVTLESVAQGEVITSTKPEFFGEGPPGETITITVESEAQTAEITVPASGEWKWSPPTDLPEGTHNVKLSWRDAGGILRTIERTFVVQAAEGGPAFEATPSATATASATPTLIPEVTDSGVLTPTIALSIMGIGIMAFSFLLWKKAEL